MAVFSIQFVPDIVPENDVDRISLIRALGDLYATMPMTKFRSKEELSPAPPAGYRAMTWHFEFVDGRNWDETHMFADPPDGSVALMCGVFGNYAAGIGFTIEPEVDLLRPVRLLTQAMTPKWGLTDIHAKWV